TGLAVLGQLRLRSVNAPSGRRSLVPMLQRQRRSLAKPRCTIARKVTHAGSSAAVQVAADQRLSWRPADRRRVTYTQSGTVPKSGAIRGLDGNRDPGGPALDAVTRPRVPAPWPATRAGPAACGRIHPRRPSGPPPPHPAP